MAKREDRTVVEEILNNRREVEKMTAKEEGYQYSDVKFICILAVIIAIIAIILHYIFTGTPW